MLEITTSWEEKGRVKGRTEGRIEGQANILVRQLKKKFNHIPVETENRVKTMPAEKLQELAEAIFDLETMEDLEKFIS